MRTTREPPKSSPSNLNGRTGNGTDAWREVWLFFGLTLGLSILVFWGPLAVFGVPAASFEGDAGGPVWAVICFILGGFTPSVVALILTGARQGRQGLIALWKRLNPLRVGWKWHGIMLFVVLLSTGIQLLIFRRLDRSFDMSLFASRLIWLLPLLILGPLSEELGWRGYALSRLQGSLNALYSSLVVGAFWALWHLPLFYILGTSQQTYGMSFLGFAAGVLAVSVLYTWVFNNTGGSIWSAVFFHWIYTYVLDTMAVGMAPPPALYSLLQPIPYVVLAILVCVVWGPRTLTRSK